ncbi:MucB/RseB C-terminal domain-containing protein [Oceanospirillum sediminis]|uniref:MucB/RseB C-terminal domain-containing protein n=1 Tax=Oceanospirillum sediminis TaxID=2760088 RepID=A0A839ILM4_9GAMM|nr:MucB/RseB C-terminal domain-containing protein [Oceanospirillum sediminis]MBB1485432.1 MucB/RseB C-terminal domain-containing protein [Oceanospirillum sediminis]
MCRSFTLGLLLLAMFISVPGRAAVTADQWLVRFSEAMHSYHYNGVLVYSREGQLDTVELSHDVNEMGEQSRLSYLDGLPREFLQHGDQIVHKISGETVASDRIHGRNPVGRFSGGLEQVKKYYQLQLKGQGRVVGRPAVIVEITPRDNQRLGYRLWLDKESALLLKSVTLDPLSRELETFQFTSFNFVRRDTPLKKEHQQQAPADGASLPWLPEGFDVYLVKDSVPVSENHLANMFGLSDGVSTFSVFIEPLRNDSLKEGVHQYGATVVVVRMVTRNNTARVVTVVGEIPLHTARKVAAAF